MKAADPAHLTAYAYAVSMRHLIAFVAAIALSACAGRQERAIVHVPASAATITIERTTTHPFFAEYDRAAITQVDGRPATRQTLFPDSGGYSRTNLYRLDAQHALPRDADASYTVGLAGGVVSKDDERRTAGMFIASFDIDDGKEWRFIRSSERGELETEFHGGP